MGTAHGVALLSTCNGAWIADTRNPKLPMANPRETMAPMKRIRRASAPSVSWLDAGCRVPRTIKEFEPGVTLRYHRSQKRAIDEGYGVVRTRELVCCICEGRAKIGYVHFAECYIEPATLNDEFLEDMDIPSAASFALAEAISSCCFVDQIADVGSVVEFHRVWMEPSRARDGLWARVANYFIHALHSKDAILLALKAGVPLRVRGGGYTGGRQCVRATPGHVQALPPSPRR